MAIDDRLAAIRADFDRLAPLLADEWDHNSHYHDLLLAATPRTFDSALEIGCGTGRFARLLATRAKHVVAIDLSPAMIERARAARTSVDNVDYRVGDFRGRNLPGPFDVVAAIATLHHVPIDEALARAASLVRSGGTLLVLDLYAGDALSKVALSPIAAP